MSVEAKRHLEKAERLLRQATALDPEDAPEALVHLSYYAMFHAATAVLIAHRDEAAKTHVGLIGSFGRLVKDRGETARRHGRALNQAEDLRLQADYGVAHADLAEAAEDLARDAAAFVDFCTKWVVDKAL